MVDPAECGSGRNALPVNASRFRGGLVPDVLLRSLLRGGLEPLVSEVLRTIGEVLGDSVGTRDTTAQLQKRGVARGRLVCPFAVFQLDLFERGCQNFYMVNAAWQACGFPKILTTLARA
jgi:hypothetical protein